MLKRMDEQCNENTGDGSRDAEIDREFLTCFRMKVKGYECWGAHSIQRPTVKSTAKILILKCGVALSVFFRLKCGRIPHHHQ